MLPPLPRHRARPAASVASLLLVLPFIDTYTVRPGDTVWDIARDHDSSVDAIVRANDLPHGGALIYPGDVLRIPSAHPRGGRATRRPTSGAAVRVEPAVHRVQDPATDRVKDRVRDRAEDRAKVSPDKRRIEVHTVKPGDTVGGIAVRYHAWTAEVIEANGGSTVLQVGERLRVPVVVAAERRAERSSARTVRRTTEADRRADVRRLVTRTARRHGVDPQLALAVSWQEAGWQQDVVSPADAVGAMQVIPSTGRWIGEVTGRSLNLRDVEDNVFAGVALLKLLTDRTGTRRSLAGYYQGLASVEANGWYDDTKRYVDNVLAIKRQFERGDYPY